MVVGKKVLLTGINGFVGLHTAIQLLDKGYEVVGTLRDLRKATSIEAIIKNNVSGAGGRVTFAQAAIDDPEAWKKLVQGIDYVQHIASPFPKTIPKNENELIIPARAGNLNILSAAARYGVKRVVITSSGGAITYGQPVGNKSRVYDETDFTDISRQEDLSPYLKSKAIAEQAAWEFMKTDRSGLELAVVCPGLILGPLLQTAFNASTNAIVKMLDGSLPAVPKIGFEVVDVRSLAALLILAMEQPDAAGERFIGSEGYITFRSMASLLKENIPAMKIPSRTLPDFLVRLLSKFDKSLKPVLLELGTERKMDHSKAVCMLGWKPGSPANAVISSAESILSLGIVKQR